MVWAFSTGLPSWAVVISSLVFHVCLVTAGGEAYNSRWVNSVMITTFVTEQTTLKNKSSHRPRGIQPRSFPFLMFCYPFPSLLLH